MASYAALPLSILPSAVAALSSFPSSAGLYSVAGVPPLEQAANAKEAAAAMAAKGAKRRERRSVVVLIFHFS